MLNFFIGLFLGGFVGIFTYERGVLSKRTSNQSFTIAKSDWQQNQLSFVPDADKQRRG